MIQWGATQEEKNTEVRKRILRASRTLKVFNDAEDLFKELEEQINE
jgi:hypothetical protein